MKNTRNIRRTTVREGCNIALKQAIEMCGNMVILAELSGLTPTTISKLTEPGAWPTRKTAEKLSAGVALKIPAEHFVFNHLMADPEQRPNR